MKLKEAKVELIKLEDSYTVLVEELAHKRKEYFAVLDRMADYPDHQAPLLVMAALQTTNIKKEVMEVKGQIARLKETIVNLKLARRERFSWIPFMGLSSDEKEDLEVNRQSTN